MRRYGFSLIEVLVVAAIVILITIVAVANIRERRQVDATLNTTTLPSVPIKPESARNKHFLCQTVVLPTYNQANESVRLLSEWQTQHPQARIVSVIPIPWHEGRLHALVITAYQGE